MSFWYPKLDIDIEKVVKSCEACSLHANQPAAAPTVSWPATSRPMDRIHVDFGQLEDKELLILIDTNTKWVEVAIMSSTTASNTIQVLRSWFARLGLPKEMVSNNGPQFTSMEFKSFLARNGIKQTLVPPYSPKSNGAAEKSVQNVKSALRKKLTASVTEGQPKLSLQQRIDDFLLTYRIMPTTATGRAPDEMLYGRKLRTRFALL